MLPSLEDQFIADSYFGVLHTANEPISGGLQTVYDGYGNASPLKISTTNIQIGTLNYPISGGEDGQFLGMSDGEMMFISIFPINSVFFTTTNTNPSAFLGGTWIRIGQGKFISSVGTGTDDGGVNKTIGSGNNSGSWKFPFSIPNHSHGVGRFQFNDDHLFILGSWNDGVSYTMGRTTGEDPYGEVVGNGSPRGTKTSLPINKQDGTAEVEPPSFGLYMWQRTA